jgi:2,3-bisphosphoglycerate-dependent phosphoglycerate mutase
VPPPGGESLKDTAARALPYYEAEIAPKAAAGNTVLVAAHGNSLRALVMKLENLSSEEILAREIATGEPIVYEIAANGSAKKIEG